MGIVYNRKTRRQFLVGAGKSLLALPLLPSLLPSMAMAQSAQSPRRIMNFLFQHHWKPKFWIPRTAATQAVGNIGAREILLSSRGSVATSAVSELLSHPNYNSLLTSNLITVARNFTVDLSGGNGHVARNMGGHTVDEYGNQSTNANHRSSFDHVIERSQTVYGNPASNVTRAIRIDLEGNWTFVHRNPGQAQSVNPNPYNYGNIGSMFTSVFRDLTQGTVPAQDMTNVRRTNILNRVMPAYQSYRGNRRISSEDRARLDNHMGYLSDLQRSLSSTVVVNPAVACTQPATTAAALNSLSNAQKVTGYMELLAIAFKCGLTKFGAMQFEWQNIHGLIHGDQGQQASESSFVNYQRNAYNAIATSFLPPLMDLEGNTGRSYLDNMLVTGLGHCGAADLASNGGPHPNNDIQHVILGTMGGRLRSGRFYLFPEMPANAFFITMLQLMGVPASEYSQYSNQNQGYGYYGRNWAGLNGRQYQALVEMLTGVA